MHRVTAIFAAAGLLLLVPIAWRTAFGEVGLDDAGLRAVVVLVAVVVGGRVATRAILAFADTLDGRWKGEVPESAVATDDEPIDRT